MRKYVSLPLLLVLFTSWESFSTTTSGTTLYAVCGRKSNDGAYIAVGGYGVWNYGGTPSENQKNGDCNSALTSIIKSDQNLKSGESPQVANYRYEVGSSTNGGGSDPSPFDCGGTYGGRTYRCLLSPQISSTNQYSEFMARALAGSRSGQDYKTYYKCLAESDLDSCLSLLKTCIPHEPYKNTYNTTNCNKFNDSHFVIDALLKVFQVLDKKELQDLGKKELQDLGKKELQDLDEKELQHNVNLLPYKTKLAGFIALSHCNGHNYAYNKLKKNERWAKILFPMYKPHFDDNYRSAVELTEWYTNFDTPRYICTPGQFQNNQLYKKYKNTYFTTGYTKSNNKYYPTSWKQL